MRVRQNTQQFDDTAKGFARSPPLLRGALSTPKSILGGQDIRVERDLSHTTLCILYSRTWRGSQHFVFVSTSTSHGCCCLSVFLYPASHSLELANGTGSAHSIAFVGQFKKPNLESRVLFRPLTPNHGGPGSGWTNRRKFTILIGPCELLKFRHIFRIRLRRPDAFIFLSASNHGALLFHCYIGCSPGECWKLFCISLD